MCSVSARVISVFLLLLLLFYRFVCCRLFDCFIVCWCVVMYVLMLYCLLFLMCCILQYEDSLPSPPSARLLFYRTWYIVVSIAYHVCQFRGVCLIMFMLCLFFPYYLFVVCVARLLRSGVEGACTASGGRCREYKYIYIYI